MQLRVKKPQPMNVAGQGPGRDVRREHLVDPVRNCHRLRVYTANDVRAYGRLPRRAVEGPCFSRNLIIRLALPQSDTQDREDAHLEIMQGVADRFRFSVAQTDERLAQRVFPEQHLDIKLD